MPRKQAQISEDSQFWRFWETYPKRVARLDAIQAWVKLNPSPETVAAILSALEWQKKQPNWLKDDGAYVPYPASWIRAQRWTDEPPVRVKPTQQAEDWYDECRRLHNNECGLSQWRHRQRVDVDRIKESA